MIRNPNIVRDRVLADVVHMFKHLYSMLTFLPETEVDVLLCLEHPQVHDLAIEVTNMLMARFGPSNHTGDTMQTSPKDPRFCKTRRRLAKKTLKGPRGVPKSNPIPDVMEST